MSNRKKFNNFVYDNLKESRSFSLYMLLNEEGSPKDSNDENDENGSEESSDFSDLDLSGDDEGKVTDSGAEAGEGEEAEVGADDISKDSEAVELQTTYDMLDTFKKIINTRVGNNKSPDEVDTIDGITKENYAKKAKLINFIFLNENKDEDPDIVKDMKNAIDKNDELLDKIKKQKAELESGTEISVRDEVRIAIDKLIHFKEKVDIVDLIEELFTNKIRLIAPIEDVESTIEEFIEAYRNEVHKNRAKIDIPGSKHYNDEEVYLDKGSDYNGAVGARSQG